MPCGLQARLCHAFLVYFVTVIIGSAAAAHTVVVNCDKMVGIRHTTYCMRDDQTELLVREERSDCID